MDTPNWVAERAKCDITALLSELTRLMQEATDRANALGRQHYEWKAAGNWRGIISCMEFGHAVRSCAFTHEPGSSVVRVLTQGMGDPKPEQGYTIGTRWDAKKSKCRLVVQTPTSEKPIEFPHKHLWKVIQYIMEPFFFPNRG